MQCPKAAIFDLDDTLAESFKRPSDDVLGKLLQLLEHIPVAIMTGSGLPRMEKQFLDVFLTSPHLDRFYLFPNSSAQCYTHADAGWTAQYDLSLTEADRARIKSAIATALEQHPELRDMPHAGEQLFDRGAQIAYTPVGIGASLEAKRAWDPDGAKRAVLMHDLAAALPDLEILLGGTTTIDITRKGVNKSYGVKWFAERLGIPTSDMYYVGDAFYDGGNDRVVIGTGIVTKAVSSPEETPVILDELLAVCST